MTAWTVWVFVLGVLGVLMGLAVRLFDPPRRKSARLLLVLSVIATLASIVGGYCVNESMRRVNEGVRKPRSLSTEQARQISDALRPFAGQPAAWLSIRRTSPTVEAYDIAQQIYGAVRAARWKLDYSNMTSDAAAGIYVSCDTLYEGVQEAAKTLVSALRRCHLSVEGPVSVPRDGQSEAPISLLVGEK